VRYDEGEGRDSSLSWLGWSFHAFRLARVDYRISWTLLVTMLFGVVMFLRMQRPELVPLAIALPPLAMLCHALGHIVAARHYRGDVDRCVLWALGDISSYQRLPLSAWPQFAVAAAGPAMSALLWAASLGGVSLLTGRLDVSWRSLINPASGIGGSDYLLTTLSYFATCNLGVAVWNLFPSMWFDGGRLWRALLWRPLGLPRATRATIVGGFVGSGLLIASSIYNVSMFGLVFGVMLLFTTIFEHRSVQFGFDPIFGVDPRYAGAGDRRPGDGLFARWRERRRQARLERIEREEASEQEVLDRLLAKVSEQGLPSLTSAERHELQRISEKQKKRAELRA
jgi:Zn-dependent protease